MIRFLTTGVMVLTLAIFGCNQSEESKPAEEQTKTTTEKVGEANETAAGEVKETAETVAEDTKQMADATADKTKEMAGQTAEASKEMMTDAKEETKEAADTVADKAVDAAKQAVSPETIVLEASYGNVTFPHALHQDSYECSICHGEGTPGLFGLDKDKAHALCRDCHKQEGAGPTGCKDCHKK
jgi:hypothetical protein